MDRPTKQFAAMLVAGFAGLAIALTGCGGNEPSKTVKTDTVAPNATVASSPETVDYNDPNEVRSALSTIQVEVAPVEPIERDRAGAAEGLLFPTWPSGEVRKAGLSTYRIDVAPEFEGKASLKFMVGKKVLYEAPFNPVNLSTELPIPPVVIEAVKVGDRVTWGVFPEGKKMKAATLDFTITEKAAATRKLSQGDTNKALSPMARAFAKANVLQNNGFLSESIQTFLAIGKIDPSVSSVYAPVVGMLRRLHLKNTPLFHDAMHRATAVTPSGPARLGFAAGGNTPSNSPRSGEFAGVGPTNFNTPAANKPGGFTPRNNGLTKNATDATKKLPKLDGVSSPLGEDAGRAGLGLLASVKEARFRADEAAALAKKIADNAADLAAKAQVAAQTASDLLQKAADLAAKAADPSLSDAERAAATLEHQTTVAQYNDALAASQAAADAAAKAAAQAAAAANFANNLDQQADALETAVVGATAGIGVVPGASTPPIPVLVTKEQKVQALQNLFNAAMLNSNMANAQFADSQAAFFAAQAALAAASDADKPAAGEALAAAQAQLEAATAAKEAADAALLVAGTALNAAQQ